MRFQILMKLFAILLSFTSAYTWTTKDQCPDTIKTTVSSDPCEYGEPSDGSRCKKSSPQFTTMDSVHDALTHCPNISALDLRVTGLGCTEFPSSWSFPLSHWRRERYPRLTSLRVEGYDFDTRRLSSQKWYPYQKPNVVVQYMRKAISAAGLEGYGEKFLEWAPIKSNLGLWLSAMDWSGIEELMISRITDEILGKVPSRLASLKRLETTNRTFIEALPNNTLTHLTWVGKSEPDDLRHVLERQGASLQNLHFRLPERGFGPFLPDFNISMLPTMAPNLVHVSLNVPRNHTWPLDTLSIISSLPHLRTADIYMNLQSECAQQRPYLWELRREERRNWQETCSGDAQYHQPKLDIQAADDMFLHMRTFKKGVELRNVTFYTGDWTRGWDGALYDPDWFDGRRDMAHCSRDSNLQVGWCDKFKSWDPDRWDEDEDDW